MAATSPAPANPETVALVVLVVDDEVAVLSALRVLLEAKGFKVLAANNPFAGVKLAVTEQPDVIVMDLDMPGMDGMEAARHLKRIEQTRHIPVIAYTGGDWSSTDYSRSGFERVARKAMGFEVLESNIEELLHRAETH